MNIFLLNDDMALGGTQTHICHLSKFLINRGHNVYLAAEKGDLIQNLHPNVIFFDINLKGKNPIKILSNLKRVKSLINKYSIDVIHIHVIFLLPFLRVLLYHKKIRIIMTVHKILSDTSWGRFHLFNKFAIYLSKSFSDSTILLNQESLDEFGYNLNNKCKIIPNGIFIENSYINEIERTTLKVINFAFSGRLISHKNIDHLLKIMKALSISVVDRSIHLHIFGYGPEEDNLKNMSEKLNIKQLVTFHGYVNNVVEKLKDIDVFLITSKSEGISYSLLEVLVVGKPIIGYEVPGVKEMVVNDYNGKLFHYNEWKYMSDWLADVINNNLNLFNAMGKNSFNIVRDRYSMEVLGERILEEYNIEN